MLEANNQPSIEVTSDSIWRLTEEVLLSLRAQATNQLRKQKRAGGLWLDDVTRAQARTIIAVRQLSETSPEGVTLKKLADTTGVTAAAASVMVDLLVKKMLKRTRSKSDRRSVLIRLDQDTATLFEITEQSLRQSVTSIGEELGPEKLREWHEILGASQQLQTDDTGNAQAASQLPDPQNPHDGKASFGPDVHTARLG